MRSFLPAMPEDRDSSPTQGCRVGSFQTSANLSPTTSISGKLNGIPDLLHEDSLRSSDEDDVPPSQNRIHAAPPSTQKSRRGFFKQLVKEPSRLSGQTTLTVNGSTDDSTDDESPHVAAPLRRALFHNSNTWRASTTKDEDSSPDNCTPFAKAASRALSMSPKSSRPKVVIQTKPTPIPSSRALSMSPKPSRPRLIIRSRSSRTLNTLDEDASCERETEALLRSSAPCNKTSMPEIDNSVVDRRQRSLPKQKSWNYDQVFEKRQAFNATRLFQSHISLVSIESDERQDAFSRSQSLPEAKVVPTWRGRQRRPLKVPPSQVTPMNVSEVIQPAESTSVDNRAEKPARRTVIVVLLACLNFCLRLATVLSTKAVRNQTAQKTWTTCLDSLLPILSYALDLIALALAIAISLVESTVHWLTNRYLFQQLVRFLVDRGNRRKEVPPRELSERSVRSNASPRRGDPANTTLFARHTLEKTKKSIWFKIRPKRNQAQRESRD